MKGLILFSDADGQQITAEYVLRYYYGELEANVEVKDCNGVTSGNLTTYIGTLTDGDFDKIHIMITADESGGTGKISFDQVASLLPKLKTASLPTASSSGDAQTNATATEIILVAGASAVNDAYNGMIIKVDVGKAGTSFLYRYVKDYVGSTKATTVNTTTTAVTDTDSYAVYDVIKAAGPIYVHTGNFGYTVWNVFYSTMTQIPRFIDEMRASTSEYLLTGTATSVANTSNVGSLTHTAAFVLAAYDGGDYYVGIRSSTVGYGQVRKIISNTANVLTLDAPWDPLPTGTIVYEIVLNRWRCLNEYFLKYAVRYLFSAPFFPSKLETFIGMIDTTKSFTTTTKYIVTQDLEYLEELHDLGEQIMVSLGRGITS